MPTYYPIAFVKWYSSYMSKSIEHTLEFDKLVVPTGNDIVIPKGSLLEVKLVKYGIPTDNPRIVAVNYIHQEHNEIAWADKVTNLIVGYNVFKRLLEENRLLPELPAVIQQALKDNKPLGASTNYQKGLVIALYNWSIDKFPKGLTGQAMEMYTGLEPKRVSNILSRISRTYEEVTDAGFSVLKVKSKIVIDNKVVYFVKHTDKTIAGGYMPKWLELDLNDNLNESYPKLTAGMYSLDPEFRGSVG